MNVTPTPVEIAGWLGCLFFLVAGMNQLMSFKAKLLGEKKEISPQPLEIRAVGDLVKEKDCVIRHSNIQKEIDELKRLREHDATEASRHRKSMYDKMDAVRDQLTEKIEETPAKVIALLRNTGAIGH